ncbi:LacI family DNA-binding transcriptional regulator [Salinibacillus xinjiangensis]|uniref:Substrate-binding domain-containing protein n=1 Tax=Salinibacillus xinjiangensis TaxID=1229268 RepID=A0A6G1XB57_9BACI|nr:LacI family DNA-binding transcriptional regulator [Salinibacillus xinjiangensis]MRG88136.1 substrate-binding domain-containing protein [Salinibacillus xinjiangensis]
MIKMTTIKDVSKKAGVSVATVSRVLNNKKVKKETVEHVLRIMKELNYSPNQIARGLSNKKTKTIALVIPVINNPFFPELASSIEHIAHKYGYKIFLCNSDDSKEKLADYIDTLTSNYIDGVIINSHVVERVDIDKLIQNKVPIVTIDRKHFEHEFTHVSVKNKDGGGIAANHLLEIGCKRIGHIKGPENERNATERYWGYRTTVHKLDWYDQSYVVAGDFSVEGGYKAMKELLIKHPTIDGVFAANDLSAIGAMKAAYEWNIKIPDDLAIIGFDGIAMTKYMVPSITTIQQPLQKMGKIAFEELMNKINNPDAKIKHHELDVSLMLQESTLR